MALCGGIGEHERLIKRLNRVRGQIDGVCRMVAEDRDCSEVLKQLLAATGALKGATLQVLQDHVHGCVCQAIATGDDAVATIDEVIDVVRRFGA